MLDTNAKLLLQIFLAGFIITALSYAAPLSTDQNAPIFLGMDNTRCGFDGKQQPIDLKLSGLYQDSFNDANAMILTSPAVSHGRVFAATSIFDPPNSYGSIFCLDARTLKLLWRAEEFELPSTRKKIELKGCISSPAVTANGRYVIFGQGLHQDSHSHLLCFDALTGKLHWAVESELHIESAPTIQGDLVIVGCGAIEDRRNNSVHGHPGYVMAVRISDGHLLWEHSINDPESSPAIQDDAVFVGSGMNGNKLEALRIATDGELKTRNQKRLIWSTRTALPISSPITLAHGLVIAGGGNGTYSRSAYKSKGMLIALDQKTGETKWQHELRDSVFGAVAVRGKTGIATSKSGKIVALDISTGEILWSKTPKPGHSIIAGAAFSGKYIYAVTTTGYLIVLDADSNGRVIQCIYLNQKSREQIDYSVSTPTLVEGRLYVASETGGLQCYTGQHTER